MNLILTNKFLSFKLTIQSHYCKCSKDINKVQNHQIKKIIKVTLITEMKCLFSINYNYASLDLRYDYTSEVLQQYQIFLNQFQLILNLFASQMLVKFLFHFIFLFYLLPLLIIIFFFYDIDQHLIEMEDFYPYLNQDFLNSFLDIINTILLKNQQMADFYFLSPFLIFDIISKNSLNQIVPDPSKSTAQLIQALHLISQITYSRLYDNPSAINGSSNCYTPIDPFPFQSSELKYFRNSSNESSVKIINYFLPCFANQYLSQKPLIKTSGSVPVIQFSYSIDSK